MKTCSNCGSTMEPDQIFCDKCGNRYVEPPPPPPQQQPSPQPPNIKKRKKRGWLIPLILLAVVACVVAIAVIMLTRASSIAMNLAKSKTMYIARQYAQYWDGTIGGYIQVLQTVSNVMSNYESVNVNDRRDQYEATLRSVFEDTPDFIQMFTIWKPNAIDGMDSRYIGRVGSTDTGQFAFALSETGEIKVMTSSVVQETMDWITGPNARVVGMSDPAPFMIQGKNTYAVRITCPILNERTNEIVGAVGCQLDIAMIQPRLEQTIKENEEIASMAIYTNTGFILANYLPQMVGKQLIDVETQYGIYLNEVAASVKNAKEYGCSSYDSKLKTNMQMAIAPVPLAASPTTWSVMIGSTESYILKEFNAMKSLSLFWQSTNKGDLQ